MQCHADRSQQICHTVPRKTLSTGAAYDARGSLMANATHYVRRIDFCIAQLEAPGPDTCHDSRDECNTPCSVERGGRAPAPWWTRTKARIWPRLSYMCRIRSRQHSLASTPGFETRSICALARRTRHVFANSSDTMYLLISFRKSTPPQNCQLNILIRNSKR
jgi:hypothetical protein